MYSHSLCVCARAPTHVSGCVRSAYDTGFPSRTVVGSSMLSHGCVVSHCGGHGGRRGQTDAHESRTIQLPSSDPSFPTEVRRRAGWLMNKYHFHSSSFQGHHNCCLSQSIERIYLFIFFFTCYLYQSVVCANRFIYLFLDVCSSVCVFCACEQREPGGRC